MIEGMLEHLKILETQPSVVDASKYCAEPGTGAHRDTVRWPDRPSAR